MRLIKVLLKVFLLGATAIAPFVGLNLLAENDDPVPGWHQSYEAAVVAIRDGDTIGVKYEGPSPFEGEDVRYAGIDAPEREYGECFAEEAKIFNQDLVLGRKVWIHPREEQLSKLLLALVFFDPSLQHETANEILVSEGYAVTLSQRYDDLEREARQARKGLWGKCFKLTPKLAISDIDYDSSDEVITIINQSDEEVDLTNYHILSEPGPKHYFTFPDGYRLLSREVVRIHSGKDAQAAGPNDLLWTKEDVWHDKGDTGWLIDPEGKYEDMYEYLGGYRHFHIPEYILPV